MIPKTALTGAALKTGLKRQRYGVTLESAHYSYHNKNKTGGNFGIVLIVSNDEGYELRGFYNTKGIVTALGFGKLYQPATRLAIDGLDIESLIRLLSERIYQLSPIEEVTS